MLTTKSAAFDNFLLHIIDETLNSLGKSVGQSIYFHIEKQFSVARTEIPQNLKKFQEGLEKIFGTGARFIEILIIKNLHAKLGHSLVMKKSEQLEFIEYVSTAKQSYIRNVTKQAAERRPFPLSLFPLLTVSVSTP
jgi:hypothetical protein